MSEGAGLSAVGRVEPSEQLLPEAPQPWHRSEPSLIHLIQAPLCDKVSLAFLSIKHTHFFLN